MFLEIGKEYPVKIISFLKFGVIALLPDKSTQLIHISNISDKFVSDISDFVKLEGEYTAKCIEGKHKVAELSLAHLNLGPVSNVNERKSQNSKSFTKCTSHTSSKRYVPQIDVRPNRPRPPKPTDQSLDDMIAASDKAFSDKFGIKPKDIRSRRTGRNRK